MGAWTVDGWKERGVSSWVEHWIDGRMDTCMDTKRPPFGTFHEN